MNKKTLEIFIVFHDENSLKYFIDNNQSYYKLFRYIYVGENPQPIDILTCKEIDIINAESLQHNIESIPTLLTFTAWYAISKNNISQAVNIGIFEYDTIFKSNPFHLPIDSWSLFGFFPRPTINDKYFLNYTPQLKEIFEKEALYMALNSIFWYSTSNVIMPKTFLNAFVNFYYPEIKRFLHIKNHPHFHERAINIFAAWKNKPFRYANILIHKQLVSHGNKIENI